MVEEKKTGSRFMMYFSTLVVSSSNLSMSLAGAWASPTLERLLQDPQSGVGPTQVTLLNCLLPAGAIASGLIARTVLDKLGRRVANGLGGLLFLTSWGILVVYQGIGWIYAARFIAGLAVGTLYLASGIYIAEVSSRDMRQMLFAACQVFTNLGFLIEYSLGPWVSPRTLALVSGAPSLLHLALLPWVVESPYFLVSRGYYEEARTVLVSLRGSQDVADEFKAIQVSVGESENTTLGDLLQGGNRRALGLASGAMVVKLMTGSWAIVSFAGPLLSEAGLPSRLASLILGLAKLATSILTILLVFKFGIKRLLVTSLLGITASLLILFAYFLMKERLNYNMEQVLWVPLGSLILFFIFNDFGIGPFPSFIGAELFTQKAKGAGTALALTGGYVFGVLTNFLLTSTDFTISLGIFALFTGISTPLLACHLVDTKDRSLAELQARNRHSQLRHHEQYI